MTTVRRFCRSVSGLFDRPVARHGQPHGRWRLVQQSACTDFSPYPCRPTQRRLGGFLRPAPELYADLEEAQHTAQALSAVPREGTRRHPPLGLDPADEPEAEGFGGQGVVTLPSASDAACSWPVIAHGASRAPRSRRTRRTRARREPGRVPILAVEATGLPCSAPGQER